MKATVAWQHCDGDITGRGGAALFGIRRFIGFEDFLSISTSQNEYLALLSQQERLLGSRNLRHIDEKFSLCALRAILEQTDTKVKAEPWRLHCYHSSTLLEHFWKNFITSPLTAVHFNLSSGFVGLIFTSLNVISVTPLLGSRMKSKYDIRTRTSDFNLMKRVNTKIYRNLFFDK